MSSSRSADLSVSATVRLNDSVLRKINQGEKVYNFGAGEPVLDTPACVRAAARRALANGQMRYPPAAGLPELRQAVADWMNDSYGARYESDNALVVNGGKFGLFILLQTLLRPGDEALIISPFWPSYPALVKLHGGIPRFIKAEQASGWKITPADIRRHCALRTKLLIFNNGCNPTGALYGKEEMAALLGEAERRGLFVISDEVYSGLAYDSSYVSCASGAAWRKNTAVVQSCSKNFAMTGWRVGFVFADARLIGRLAAINSQSITGVAVVSQLAALSALRHAAEIMASVRRQMLQRRDAFIKNFRAYFAADIPVPSSGLYAFIPLACLGAQGVGSERFCARLLKEANVAMAPGAAFGREGYVRCSFGECPAVLRSGLRIAAVHCRARYPLANGQKTR